MAKSGGETAVAVRAASGARGRRTWVLVGLVLVLAVGVGGWAAVTGVLPFGSGKERYCWGAWEQDSGPSMLGGSGSRSVEESPPEAGRVGGTCTVTMRTSSDTGSGTNRHTERVSVRYGAVPGAGADRRAWIGEFLDAQSDRLPGGLAGTVGTDRGVLVLPKRCETNGRTTAVTLRADGRTVSDAGETVAPVVLGTEREVATMLLDAANAGMRKTGCDAGSPLTLPSAFPPEDRREEVDRRKRQGLAPEGDCAIPGLRGGPGTATWSWSGTDRRLRICSVTTQASRNEPPRTAGQFLAVTEPRLVALFDGMTGDKPPAPGWRGKGVIRNDHAVVRARCGDTDAVFFQQLDAGMREAAAPDPQHVFTEAVTTAAQRVGCPRVTSPG